MKIPALIVIALASLALAGCLGEDTTAVTQTGPDKRDRTGKGYPLAAFQVSAGGSYRKQFPVPKSILPLITRIRCVEVALADREEARDTIQAAAQSRGFVLGGLGEPQLRGAVPERGSKKGDVKDPTQNPGITYLARVPLLPLGNHPGSGTALFGISHGKGPIVEVNVKGLPQVAEDQTYVIWLLPTIA